MKLALSAAARPSVWVSANARTARWLIVALWLALFLIRGGLYLALIPPWQSPDEPTSVELLLTMQARGRLISQADMDPAVQRQITASMQRTNYWDFGLGRRPDSAEPVFAEIWGPRTQLHRPPLYHLLLLPSAYATAGWSLEARLYLWHFISLLLVSLTVLIAIGVGWEFAPTVPALPWVMAALVVLHPQLTVIGVSVNSDNLAGLIGALVFWLLLRVARAGLSWQRGLLLAALLLLGLWTKRTTLFLWPTVVLGLLAPLRSSWPGFNSRQGRRILTLGAATLLAPLAVLGLWPGVGVAVGAVLNRNLFDNAAGARFSRLLEHVLAPPFSLGEWFQQNITFLNRTFWADFGWHRGILPAPLATTLMIVLGTGWLLALLVYRQRRAELPGWQRQFIGVCWAGVGLALLQTLLTYYASPYELPHGRYLFPAFVPIIFLLSFGLSGWWRRSWTRPLSGVVMLLAIMLDVYAVVGILIPTFYLS